MKMRIIIFSLLILQVTLPVSANSMYTAEVIASSLNVRSIPDNEGRIIGSLYRGQKILVETTSTEWVKTKLEGDLIGYVSSIHLKMIDTSTTGENPISVDEIKCKPKLSNIKLSIRDADMPCKNSIEKSGLGSCTAKFIVDIESTCTEIADVNIECGAGFKYDTNNSYTPYETEKKNTGTVYVDKGFGTTTIDVKLVLADMTEPVIKVELVNGMCSVLDIKNYN